MGDPVDPGPVRLVVGVTPGQPDAVVVEAAAIAQRIGGELELATVDVASYAVEQGPDGIIVALPLDADAPEAVTESFDPALAARIDALVAPTGVRYRCHALAGDPAQELAELAEAVGAQAIVVGVRERGLRTAAHEFLNGSVGAHLAHRQHRPVILIPVDPIGFEADPPWRD